MPSLPSLRDRWKAFWIVMLDPWTILLLISTILLSVVLINQTDFIISVTLTFLVSLFSGVLGGIISKRWDDITEEKIIVTRAKSATRSLELLLSSIIALEKRTRLYLERHNDAKKNQQITSEVVKTYFEEIVDNCIELEEKTVNSIEDWKDILPNLELKTVLNVIRELKINYGNALSQLEQVNLALQQTKDKTEEDKKKLEKEKQEIYKELLRIQKEVQEKSFRVGVPSVGTSLITGSTDFVFDDASGERLPGLNDSSQLLANQYKPVTGTVLDIYARKQDDQSPKKTKK